MFKMGCQKHFTKLQKMKNTQSEIKPIKIGKRPRTTYCFERKNFTHSFRPEEVKWQAKFSEKNVTVLFVDQVGRDF